MGTVAPFSQNMMELLKIIITLSMVHVFLGRPSFLSKGSLDLFNEGLEKVKLQALVNQKQSGSLRPSVRMFLNDQLFMHHLNQFLDNPSQQQLNLLRSRARTLRRRKTQLASTLFFLRN